jgi:hypothetical protein
MNIEDLLIHLYGTGSSMGWYKKIIKDMAIQVGAGIGFTKKQSELAVKIITKHRKILGASLNRDINLDLVSPVYRIPFRVLDSGYLRTMSIVDADEGDPFHKCKKLILVKFPYNDLIISQIQARRLELYYAVFDTNIKAWTFSLDEYSLSFLRGIADHYNFQIDEELDCYFKEIKRIEEQFESIIPTLVMCEDGYLKLVNVSEYVPQIPKTTDVISSVIAARKLGITVWCSKIQEKIDQLNQPLRNFINSSQSEPFMVNMEKDPFESVSEIISNMLPCLVILNQVNQLELLKKCHKLFKKMGIDNTEISVSFRLDGKNNKDFNEYVAATGLNSAISEQTKVVFIGNRLPKPMIKSGIKFNCVLYFNNINFADKEKDDYMVKKYIRNSPNVVYYAKKLQPKNRETYAIMYNSD